MPAFFSSNAGRIAAVALDDGFVPLGVIMGDFKSYVGLKGVLTGVNMMGQSGAQVRHSLRRKIFIYSFGERVGRATVSGLSLVSACNDGNGLFDVLFRNRTGLERAHKWYEHNRLSTTGLPITLTLTPGLVVSAFLLGFKYDMVDPSLSLGQFAMDLIFAPRQLTALQADVERTVDKITKVNIRIGDATAGGPPGEDVGGQPVGGPVIPPGAPGAPPAGGDVINEPAVAPGPGAPGAPGVPGAPPAGGPGGATGPGPPAPPAGGGAAGGFGGGGAGDGNASFG